MWVGNVSHFRRYDELFLSKEKITVSELVLKAAQSLYPYIEKTKNPLIIAGKGNNGADGLCLAGLLAESNHAVSVYLADPVEKLGEAAACYYQKLGPSQIISSYDKLLETIQDHDAIIDALLGTGLNHAPQGMYETLINLINAQNATVYAIDIPSGLRADDGEAEGACVKADVTLCLAAMKAGFYNPEAAIYTGQITVVPFSADESLYEESGMAQTITAADIKKIIKPRAYAGYKGRYGYLSVHAGSDRYPGAAMLAAGAALYAGCGLVSLHSDEKTARMAVWKYPELILGGGDEKQATAFLFGCGKTTSPDSAHELETILKTSAVPVLIDADGLNLLAQNPKLLELARCPLILTPHIGEMKRLDAEGDVYFAARAYARRHHVTVVLKGPLTMVTDGKRCYRVCAGDRAMATAGMGDTLAGIIASFLAQGYDPVEACLAGVYCHGRAGELLAKKQYTVLAEQVITMIPEVMKASR